MQAAINAATNLLPADLPAPPIYAKVNPADAPILTLALTSKTLPLTEVEDLAETRLAQKISQQPGVGLVTIAGGQRPAVRVQANPRALAAYGLNIDDVRTTLGNANVNAPKGSFDGPAQASTIDANDQITERRRLRATWSSPTTTARRCGSRDVATVVDGAENTKLAAWTNTHAGGHPQRPAPARRQRHRRGRRDRRAAAAAAGRPAGRGRRRGAHRPHRRPSAPRSPTSSSSWCWPSCWWCW